MSNYGEFTIFPTDFGEWTLVAAFEPMPFTLDAGGINLYGKAIRTFKTAEKACRVARYYERRMGRNV